MTQENNPNQNTPNQTDQTKTGLQQQDGQLMFDHYQQTVDRFLQVADVKQVYGDPIEHAGYMVIPAAEVVAGMGFGIGAGQGMGEEGQGGSGSGGGGGGRSFSRPVAVIVASDQGVEVQPVFDITKVGLTALTAAGFMFATIGRMVRGPRHED